MLLRIAGGVLPSREERGGMLRSCAKSRPSCGFRSLCAQRKGHTHDTKGKAATNPYFVYEYDGYEYDGYHLSNGGMFVRGRKGEEFI